MARTSLIVGIDEGGTNTDTALVFTPGGDDAAVAEQIAAWGLALSSAGREEEVAELRRQHQSERRRRGLIWVRRKRHRRCRRGPGADSPLVPVRGRCLPTRTPQRLILDISVS